MALHIVAEANRCLNCKNPRCQQGCPVHTPIPTVIQLFKENRLMEGFDGFDEAISWCETIGGHAQWYFMTQEEKKGDLYMTGAVACTDGEKTFLFYREGV